MSLNLFHLGREPELSTAEIEAVFSTLGIEYTVRERSAGRLITETKQPIDAGALMNRLGGTIKIAEWLSNNVNNHPPAIISHLTTAQPAGKIDFAVNNRQLALTIKKKLKTLGRGARFITIKNTATILFNHLVEKQGDLTVLGDQIFVTRAIQPILELGQRDYGRPASDSKSGMLPPKLAKIMINLAQVPQDAIILDPFCGSGTILMEAAIMGYQNFIGSDISDKAIKSTKQNLAWLTKKLEIGNSGSLISNFQIYQSDARSLDKVMKPYSIDAIITEPYLGRPLTGRETKSFLEHQTQNLAALYTEAFASFKKILKPGGVVVFITPSFKHKTEWIALSDSRDFLGFKAMPFLGSQYFLRYHRPGQHLARDVWRWVKT